MDYFLDYLIKKSDLDNNEFFNYRQPQKNVCIHQRPTYTKILLPSACDYVVFDLETTGMNCRVNKIIEVGAVKVNNGAVVDKFSALVDPEQYIPAYISQKVHITNQMVAGKPTIEAVLPSFVHFIGDLPLVAHNASFDMGFLLTNAQQQGIEILNPVIDTLSLSRKFNKECEKHNLGYLSDFYNISLNNAHRAWCDAMATQQLYEIIRKKYLDKVNS